MKRLILLLLILFSNKFVIGQVCDGEPVIVTQDGQCDSNPWILVFEDNFDGNSLDLTKWSLPYQGVIRDYDHLKEKQWYVNTGSTPSISIDNNISVSNGILKLTAKRDTVVGTYVTDWSTIPPTTKTETFYYTSAEIDSKYKFSYGKYEIRCKIPSGKGFWPAFWMYGEDANHVNNEIDVFEFWDNNTNDHNMTMHYNGQMCLTDYNGPDYSQSFHTFTVMWDNYKIEWYVDGNLKRRVTKFYTILGQVVDCNGIQASGQYILENVYPKDPMNIISNLAIQTGTFQPDINTPFPSSLEIDYIRYYKQMSCSGALNITSTSQLNLTNSYNVIIGTTINLNTNVTLQSGQQLELIARDEITLENGFSANFGSAFIAKLSSSICSGVPKMGSFSLSESDTNTNNLVRPILMEENQYLNPIALQNNSNFTVKAYPNPNKGMLSLEFDLNSFSNLQLYLIDEQGKVVYSLNSIKNNKVNINIENLNKGMYLLNIIDIENKNVYVNKLIYN